MSLMFVISLRDGKKCALVLVLEWLWIVEAKFSMLLEGHGVLSGWMFLRRPDSFDETFTLVSCAHVPFHILCHRRRMSWWYLLAGVLIPTASPKPLAHRAYFDSLSDIVPAETDNKDKYGFACGWTAGNRSSWLYRIRDSSGHEREKHLICCTQTSF
jgi:hypothetical protein